MSTLALMRWLESAPDRYDAGMRWITLGRVEALHAAVVEAAAPAPGARVLEIGCGTGAVTQRLVARGAHVTAVEQSPEMLERARTRIGDAPVHWLERTASEIDALGDAGFDAVVASLCFSEMSSSERAFVLRAARAALRPGGRLVVADEVVPRSPLPRVVCGLLRAPQAALGWLLAGSLSRPLRALPSEIEAAGFAIRSESRWLLQSLAAVVAERP